MIRAVNRAVACVAVLIATAGQVQADLIVADSFNESATPHSTTWVATEVGWFYTPEFSYDLAGITTKFGSADSRIVTVEIYDAFPGSGGTLLRSADFTPLSNAFAGGEFAPLSLVANHTYFFGFRNVGNLGVSVTKDAGAISLPGGLRFSVLNNGSYQQGPDFNFAAQPIVQFQTQVSTTPEPSSLALFGVCACVAGVGTARRRRHEKQQVTA